MRAQDIVDKLSAKVPLHTDGFSESVGITSITVVGVTATVTTDSAHGMIDGQNAAILNAEAPVQIDTFLRTGTLAVFETLQDHDFTLSQRDKATGGKTLTISGAIEAEFNGTFEIDTVNNRRKITITVADSGPTTITGSPIVEDANGGIFNGLVPVTNIAATTFDYTLANTYPLDAVVDNATVQTSIRILSVLDIEQYLRDVYTKQTIGDDQVVVQLGDVSISKKRGEETDASSSSVGNDSYTPILIQTFAIYLILNVTDQLTAAQARDKVESEYIPAIFQSVVRAKFDTGFTYNIFRSTFVGHGVFAYSDDKGKNKAIYAHEITFEQLVTITGVDMVEIDETVAMRDVEYTLSNNIGVGTMTADVNLDEEP